MSENCDRRRYLTENIARTVANTHTAIRERDVAMAEGKDLIPYRLAIEEARQLEREAFNALARDKNQHPI